MSKNEQACAYLQAMAAKLGADVTVYQTGNRPAAYTMRLKGAAGLEHSVQVSPEDSRESFDAKVRRLLNGSQRELRR